MNSTAARVAKGVIRMPVASAIQSEMPFAHQFPHCPAPAIMASPRPEHAGKLTVVLDIDETLIHTDMQGALDMRYKNNSEAAQAKAGQVTSEHFHIDLDDYRIKVYKRPHLEWFLKEASAKFELVTFTAGEQHYGSTVLGNIDPHQTLIKHRFFRHNCTQLGDHLYTKDLSNLNRPLSRVVLVDNNPICFLPNPENGVPVNSFYAQEEDTTLKSLMAFLDHLNGHVDVRPVLQQQFRLKERLGLHYGTVAAKL